ncbi:polysaccharide pyruvyl transferase family protein [Methylobacterium sp. Leaf85]|uniref:polysaccharide pyruvyl transferase family protein n=1 Tax=Methylobacterium sp. Leaf85 TaxID=1736241 RepID=UPI0009E7D5FD|nr:polysaccharide pyruvyl transferase family protein [Methylobacterium sp. Leaf85]
MSKIEINRDKLKIVTKSFINHVSNGDWAESKRLENDLILESPEVWTPLVSAFRSLRMHEEIAAEADLAEAYRPRMWWMRSPYPGNFGDILTPYVLWHAFGVMPRWVLSKHAEGLCIGSIAKFARPGMRLWGTGMPRSTDALCPTAVYSAVRGPLSRDAIIAAGGSCPKIYGDPAILLPELYRPDVAKSHSIGIIPHVSHESMFRAAINSTESKNIKIISLLSVSFDDIECVIREISSCKEIVTTSLHGLIVAHAYGIPSQSASIEDEVGNAHDSFKMQDYKLSVGLADLALRVPQNFTDLAWLERRECVLPPSQIDSKALRAAFPFPSRSIV